MRVERVYLDGIETGERLRPLDPERVAAMQASIREIGLRTPLTVMSKLNGDDTRMILVAGHHRLEALRANGDDAAPCFVIDDDEIDAKLWEIAENLYRSDLSKEQRDEHIRLYAKLLSEKEEREKPTQAAHVSAAGGRGNKSIATKVAEQVGLHRDTVKRALNPSPPKPPKVADSPVTDEEAVERQVAALMSAWNKASPEARTEFMARIDVPVMDRRAA